MGTLHAGMVADRVTRELEEPFTRWMEEGKTLCDMAGYVAASYMAEGLKRADADEEDADKAVEALQNEMGDAIDAAMAELPILLARDERVRFAVFHLNQAAQILISYAVAKGYELGTGVKLPHLIDTQD